MPVLSRPPRGVQTISVVSANLFVLAAQYLGDATQWQRIAALNSFPGTEPDFLVAGPTTLKMPSRLAGGSGDAPVPIEQMLFGVSS